MNLNARLQRLEKTAAMKIADSPCRSFPANWVRRKRSGDFVGPPKNPDPRELQTYQTVIAMLATMD